MNSKKQRSNRYENNRRKSVGEIDIEKACKVYKNELQRLKKLLDESVGVPANLVSVDKSLSRIAKEMLYEDN